MTDVLKVEEFNRLIIYVYELQSREFRVRASIFDLRSSIFDRVFGMDGSEDFL